MPAGFSGPRPRALGAVKEGARGIEGCDGLVRIPLRVARVCCPSVPRRSQDGRRRCAPTSRFRVAREVIAFGCVPPGTGSGTR